MRLLMVAVCFATAVSVAQADSLNSRRVGYCSTPGRAWGVAVSGYHVYVADDMFGLRTVEVRDLQSPDEGVYSYAQDSARRAHVPGGGDYVAEAGGALLGGALVGAGAAVVLGAVGAAAASSAYPSTSSESAVFGWAIISGAAGAAVGYPLGCGLGTILVGRATHADGNTGGAYAGAYIGMVVAVPVALSGVGAVIAPLLPPAGAVTDTTRAFRGRVHRARSVPGSLRPRCPTVLDLAWTDRDTPLSIAGW
jgi:hypothetical protein